MPSKEEYEKNPEYYRAYSKTYMRQWRAKWLAKHPASYNEEYQKRWREKHPNYMREWRDKNRELYNKLVKQWGKANPKRFKELRSAYKRVAKYPELYPLDEACIFCASKENLEHGHLDYEDEGYNYVTTCHQCNLWMKIP